MAIHTIYGKKGGGKSTLSKALAAVYTNKIVYISPVETLNHSNFEAWTLEEIYEFMPNMNHGEILHVKNAEVDAMEVIASFAMRDCDYTLVIDEAERYNKSKALEECVHYCRHFRVNIIANTRRYTEIPILLRSQYDYFYTFKITERADLQYIQGIVGEENIHIIPNLQQFQYFQFPTCKTAYTPKSTYL